MKPNFALTLSAEGIRLLHRAPSGWLLVGDADFETGDLPGVLAGLRADAQLLSPSELRSKLVLPNDQIKYMTIRSDARTEEDAEAEAAAALEGATPYALSELAFDWSLDDGQLYLAAVARETLAEAEGFAVEHGFNPVSFVALPEQTDFPGEPFFGLTRAARGLLETTENVARDLQPIHVIGMAEIPEPELLPDPEPEPEPEPEAAEPEPVPVPASAPVSVPEETQEPAETEAAPAPEPPAESPSDSPIAPDEPEQAEETDAPAAPVMSFASVRASRDVPDGAAQTVSAPPADLTDLANLPDPIESVTAPSIPAPSQGPDKDKTDDKAPSLIAGFRSRRKAPDAPKAAKPKPKPKSKPQAAQKASDKADDKADEQAERQRMTMFGARKTAPTPPVIGGKPRYMGLALTVILLVFLAVVALWASYLSPNGLAGLFGSDPEQIQLAEDTAPQDPNAATQEELAEAQDVEPAGEVDPALSEGQAIVRPDTPDLITPEEAERRYIATGIWQLAPQQPAVPAAAGDADVYQASIDPQVRTVDAVALPDIWVLHDSAPNETLNPTAPGTTFDTDERGLVRATPEGALTPEGITVYAGRPAAVPAQLPTRRGDGLSPAELERLAQVRPRARPDDLQETTQRGQLGGRTLSELAAIRPKARPSSITPQSAEPQEDAATPQAVAMSLRPKTRPKNFAQLVERTQKAETRVAAAAPSIPSSASVARQATVKNALNLKKLNLIGVNGKSGNRRALVRTQNGRYKTVKVGDRLDGGKVAAITETELRYTKNGKSVVLKMPRG